MDENEKVLTVEVWDNEFHYRIRRGSRIVYVSVFHKDIIPGELFERTENRAILSHLRRVPKWDEQWTTLTVRKTPDGTIESTIDEFPPHSLDIDVLGIRDQAFYDILGFESTSRLSDRIYQVTLGTNTMMMKIAPYQYLLPALHQEIDMYSLLASRGFPRAPNVLGYVYEESKARAIGFLMEKISGRTPGPEDLEECEKTVRLLHQCGILHGDVNKYNFRATDQRAIVFDFESATVKEVGEVEGSEESIKEIADLAESLNDDSGVGKPFWEVLNSS